MNRRVLVKTHGISSFSPTQDCPGECVLETSNGPWGTAPGGPPLLHQQPAAGAAESGLAALALMDPAPAAGAVQRTSAARPGSGPGLLAAGRHPGLRRRRVRALWWSAAGPVLTAGQVAGDTCLVPGALAALHREASAGPIPTATLFSVERWKPDLGL